MTKINYDLLADAKPTKKKSYAAKKPAHMAEFKANSRKRWEMVGGICEHPGCNVWLPEETACHHHEPAGQGGWRNNAVENLRLYCQPHHDEAHGH